MRLWVLGFTASSESTDMSSAKATNHLLLGAIAFGVSFTLGLLIKLDLAQALLIGSVTLPGIYIGTIGKSHHRSTQTPQPQDASTHPIQDLSVQVNQLHQSLAQGRTLKQQLQTEIQTLKAEHNRLMMEMSALTAQKESLSASAVSRPQLPTVEITNVSEQQVLPSQPLNQGGAVYQPRVQSYPEVTALEVQQEELEAANAGSRLEFAQLEQERTQLNQAIAHLRHHYQETVAQLMEHQEQLEQTVSQLEQAQVQRKQLQQEVVTLDRRYQYLTHQTHNLQAELGQLETERTQLSQVIAHQQQRLASLQEQVHQA